MKALVVFCNAKGIPAHPLARFLRDGFEHCFVCMCHNGLWLALDGGNGFPVLKYLTDEKFDLAGFYREQEGIEVIELEQGKTLPASPLALRNCVGFVKAMLCISSWAWTPYQLFKYLRKSNERLHQVL